MHVMISVIVPVFNTENYLKKCIDSILQQTYQDIELIIVDDGSTDNSFFICKEYERKDRRVKVIHKENGGQGSARNVGLDVCKGEYVIFVDSDDYILPDMFQILMKNAMLVNADISCCAVYSQEDGSDKKEECNLIIKQNYEAMSLFVNNRGCFNHSPVGKLFARHTIERMRFAELTGFEDAASIFRAFIEANVVVAQNISLYFYYQREMSTMHRAFSENDFDRVRAYRIMEQALISNTKYIKLSVAVTEAKIGAIYFVAGEAMRKKINHKNEIIQLCIDEAKATKKQDNNLSLKNKVLLECLIRCRILFGAMYMLRH